MFKAIAMTAATAMVADAATNCTTTVAQWFNTTSCQAWAVSSQTDLTAAQTSIQTIALGFAKCSVSNYVNAGLALYGIPTTWTPYMMLLAPATDPAAYATYGLTGLVGKNALTMYLLGNCASTTTAPTKNPTLAPTRAPTTLPTVNPTSSKPTTNPTSSKPTTNPTTRSPTTKTPTKSPVRTPTVNPTRLPTVGPTVCPVAWCNSLMTNYSTVATATCNSGKTGLVTASNCAGFNCNAEIIAQCEGTSTSLSSDLYWGIYFVKQVCNSQLSTQTNCTALLPKPPAPSGSASGVAASAVSAVAVVAAMFAM